MRDNITKEKYLEKIKFWTNELKENSKQLATKNLITDEQMIFLVRKISGICNQITFWTEIFADPKIYTMEKHKQNQNCLGCDNCDKLYNTEKKEQK